MYSLDDVIDDIVARLARIERFIRVLMRAAIQDERRDTMAQDDINRLKAAVAANSTVVGSTVVLIQGLIQQVKDAADDPVELAAAIAELEANTQALAAAVPVATPAA